MDIVKSAAPESREQSMQHALPVTETGPRKKRVRIHGSQASLIEEIKLHTGLKTDKDVVEAALAAMGWIVRGIAGGGTVLLSDEDEERQLEMTCLKRMRFSIINITGVQ